MLDIKSQVVLFEPEQIGGELAMDGPAAWGRLKRDPVLIIMKTHVNVAHVPRK